MTRSSTNELFTPFEEPERKFQSSRKHFKTPSLDELRSPDFNLFSDQEYSKEEVAKIIAKTMEQYMSKTRADYGSGILDSRGAIPSKTVADAKVAIQEMAEYSQNRHSCCQVFISAGVLFLLLEYSVPAVRLYNSRYGRGYQSTLDPRRPFLSTACAKIDVYKRKITLRVGEERIIFTSIKPVSSLIKRVYILSLRERMELDLEVRLMGETLVLNRSLDPSFEDCIELNDLNEPIELRRSQGNELMPTIEEGEVIKEFRTRDDKLDTKINDYPSYCDHDKKIHIDCAYNLKFSCMIDFVVIEDMDAYRDKVMGDAIFGEPFLREVGINAKWFEGISTIYNGNDEVPWTNERPLENRELNAIIGAWFTLWRD
nr:ulp1 protease family, C-terminal catalytic domain-containing protein [Tanacetum cinerariifolium]